MSASVKPRAQAGSSRRGRGWSATHWQRVEAVPPGRSVEQGARSSASGSNRSEKGPTASGGRRAGPRKAHARRKGRYRAEDEVRGCPASSAARFCPAARLAARGELDLLAAPLLERRDDLLTASSSSACTPPPTTPRDRRPGRRAAPAAAARTTVSLRMYRIPDQING